jgi:hypothetical protein
MYSGECCWHRNVLVDTLQGVLDTSCACRHAWGCDSSKIDLKRPVREERCDWPANAQVHGHRQMRCAYSYADDERSSLIIDVPVLSRRFPLHVMHNRDFAEDAFRSVRYALGASKRPRQWTDSDDGQDSPRRFRSYSAQDVAVALNKPLLDDGVVEGRAEA